MEPEESNNEPGNVRETSQIIEEFTRKLKRSGYRREQAQEIVRSGLIGYKTKWEPLREPHRSATDTEQSRRLKRLTGKTSWYKQRRVQDSKQQRPGDKRHRQGRPDSDKPTIECRPNTVLFVERTQGGPWRQP